jgi:hypothetical protein
MAILDFSDTTLPTAGVNEVETLVPTIAELDYEIFPVKGVICFPPNEIQLPTSNGRLKSLTPNTVIRSNNGGNIWAATATTGPVAGEVSRCPYILRMPGWSKFQEVWTLRLKRTNRTSKKLSFGPQFLNSCLLTFLSEPGDSGSWVVDAEFGNLYGHIVAGRPGTYTAYILPAYKIFEDVEKRSGCRVSLEVAMTLSDPVVSANIAQEPVLPNKSQRQPVTDDSNPPAVVELSTIAPTDAGPPQKALDQGHLLVPVMSASEVIRSANFAWNIYQLGCRENSNAST